MIGRDGFLFDWFMNEASFELIQTILFDAIFNLYHVLICDDYWKT